MDKIINLFRDKKLKLTPQRLAVYKYLMNTTEHPSAETIYKSLHIDYPTMSLATVYKAIKTLVEVGLIQELNVGEGNFRYDGNAISHPHIQCINCSKVEDFQSLSFNELNACAEKHTDYIVLSNKVYFYGLCPNCKN